MDVVGDGCRPPNISRSRKQRVPNPHPSPPVVTDLIGPAPLHRPDEGSTPPPSPRGRRDRDDAVPTQGPLTVGDLARVVFGSSCDGSSRRHIDPPRRSSGHDTAGGSLTAGWWCIHFYRASSPPRDTCGLVCCRGQSGLRRRPNMISSQLGTLGRRDRAEPTRSDLAAGSPTRESGAGLGVDGIPSG